VTPTIGTADAAASDIVLLSGRAAWIPVSRTLLVADLHLGKAATFRRAGIPVPEGTSARDLARLAALVRDTGADRLLILGDLFHSRGGCTERVLSEFTATRRSFPRTRVVLVPGNHDRAVGRLPRDVGLDACEPTVHEPPFHFVHEPDTPPPADRGPCFTVAGHLHPTVSIRAPSGDRLTERCFVAEEARLVMPAFGSFTGGERVTPRAGLRLWIARDDGVVDVTRAALLATRGRR